MASLQIEKRVAKINKFILQKLIENYINRRIVVASTIYFLLILFRAKILTNILKI